MKRQMQLVTLTAALVLLSATTAAPVSAQHPQNHGAVPKWKTGMVRISGSVWAGNVRLKRGMYHVEHVVEGDRPVLVFKSVALLAGYQEGFMWEGKEVARLVCSVEPTPKSTRNTKIAFARTFRGESSIQAIQIAGEKVRHVLARS